MTLTDYVISHTIRGACTCGRCIDAPDKPEEIQPSGHTIDLTFFKVAMKNEPKLDEFIELVKEEFPDWLDGKEHNYLQGGAQMGDQGICLQTFALGHLLGAWNCLCPSTMIPFLSEELKKYLVSMGMITIKKES